ncbi:MAG TPA: hypothetical protein ENN41_11390 [Sediminispirochaeta sp.]|nr:hypothetical protein [Sediminispirochaeta sp.]
MDEAEKSKREYQIALLTNIKKCRRRSAEKRAELDKWEQRIEFARSMSKEDLALQAEKKKAEIQFELEELNQEEQELTQELREAQVQDNIEGSILKQEVDPELLLRKLQEIAPPEDSYHNEVKKASVERELQELKRRLDLEQNE